MLRISAHKEAVEGLLKEVRDYEGINDQKFQVWESRHPVNVLKMSEALILKAVDAYVEELEEERKTIENTETF